jgi:hypothetical protein
MRLFYRITDRERNGMVLVCGKALHKLPAERGFNREPREPREKQSAGEGSNVWRGRRARDKDWRCFATISSAIDRLEIHPGMFAGDTQANQVLK